MRRRLLCSNSGSRELYDLVWEAEAGADAVDRYWVSIEASRGTTTAGDMTFHIIEPHRLCTIAGIVSVRPILLLVVVRD